MPTLCARRTAANSPLCTVKFSRRCCSVWTVSRWCAVSRTSCLESRARSAASWLSSFYAELAAPASSCACRIFKGRSPLRGPFNIRTATARAASRALS